MDNSMNNSVQEMIKSADTETVKMLSWMYKHAWVKTLILVVFGLYIVFSPKIPMFVVKLYANKVFKFLVVLLILFLSAHDVQLAIMMAVVYLLTVHRITCGNNEYFTDGGPPPGDGNGSPPPRGDGNGSPPPGGTGGPRPSGTGGPPPGGTGGPRQGGTGGPRQGGTGSTPPSDPPSCPPECMVTPPPGSTPPVCPAGCMKPSSEGSVAGGDDTKTRQYAPV